MDCYDSFPRDHLSGQINKKIDKIIGMVSYGARKKLGTRHRSIHELCNSVCCILRYSIGWHAIQRCTLVRDSGFKMKKHIEVQEFHEVEIFSTVQRTHFEIRSQLPPSDSIPKIFPLSQFVRLRKYGRPKVPTYSTEYVHQRTRTYLTSYLSHKTP